MLTWVYWYYDDQGCIYAGRTNNPDRRENEHWSKSPWRTGGQHCERRIIPAGLNPAAIEHLAIRRLRPRANQRDVDYDYSHQIGFHPAEDRDAWIAAWHTVHARHLDWVAANIPAP
jgi:hypothetical protein